MTPLRAGIIGCGRIAGLMDAPSPDVPVTTHAQAYTRHPHTDLAGACEPDRDRARVFGTTWGVPVYASIDELLTRERPGVVSICSRAEQHFSHARDVLTHANAPRALLIEKPICLEASELSALTALAGDRLVLVNHTRRFDPPHQAVARTIHDGILGRCVSGRGVYYGGWILNGTHLVDLLRMMLGPVSIQAVRAGAAGRGDDDCPAVTLSAGNALIEAEGFDERYYQLFEVELRFERGRVCLQDFGSRVRIERVSINGLGERVLVGEECEGLVDPLLHAVGAMTNSLHNNLSVERTGATLRDVAETMNLVWQAARARAC